MHMRITAAVGLIMFMMDASVSSQEADTGRREFLSNCAACHGEDGKGVGGQTAKMRTRPTDLTTLAKKTNGVFLANAVYEAIDGRASTTFHRSPDMPIWGCRHSSLPFARPGVHNWLFAIRHAGRKKMSKPTPDALESLVDISCDPEPVIRDRITAIVDYISRIQQQ